MKARIRNIRRSPLLPIFFTVFLDLVSVGIVIPILPTLFLNPNSSILPSDTNFQTRVVLFGLLGSAFSFFQFFGSPILGALSDKYGRKKLLLLTLCGTFVGYLLFILAITSSSVWMLFLSRAIKGFMGGNIAIAMSAIADVSKPADKAKNFGLIGMAFGLGFIVGPFIGGKLADPSILPWFGLAVPFIFASIMSLFNIGLLIFNFDETLSKFTNKSINIFTGLTNLKKAFDMVNLRIIFITSFLITFGFTFFMNTFQVFLVEKFAMGPSEIANIFAYLGLWIALTQGIITRILSRKFSSAQILKVLMPISAVVFIIIFPITNPLLLFAVLPVLAISNGLINPNITAIVSNLARSDQQGEIIGVNQSISSIAMAIPPLLAGFFLAININIPLLVASGIVFVAWFIFTSKFKSVSVPDTNLPKK
jgi:DHA1 family tetracycline resistance protein-like MFS transporter